MSGPRRIRRRSWHECGWPAILLLLVLCVLGLRAAAGPLSAAESPTPGAAPVRIDGEPRQWHKVTLSLDGPRAAERDDSPNPFTDYRFSVTFRHESGMPAYRVPGYFAADGDAAETSAEEGTVWRAHLSPDKPGTWTYRVEFVQGPLVAVQDEASGRPVTPLDGLSGSFRVLPTDKRGRDFRARGRLRYVGRHYLRFAGSGESFLKAGPDSPETLLASRDFDGTRAGKRQVPLKTWEPHIRDWKPGDPTWQEGKGKGLVGALNYLASRGCNAFSFLPYNAGGDGDNVWPFVTRDAKLHYDCSKLDQWQIVFDHAQRQGLYLHFKLQEQEMDDNRRGQNQQGARVAEALDGGDLGVERKLYCRELVARFGHALALNWNLGEENTQSAEQQRAMARYLRDIDPYDHHIVVHTFPNAQDRVYPALLGEKSVLTGASLQNSWSSAHQRTLQWVEASAAAGKPWVVANDEQNPASDGVPPDPGYEGHDGFAEQGGRKYSLHDIRKHCLWGTLMAGGAGVEYYFGYRHPQNDLLCEDFRSRERSWDYCRVALDFFREHEVPLERMANHDRLVGNPGHDNSRYCFAAQGELYLVYLPQGGTAKLDLTGQSGAFSVAWLNPRAGGPLREGSPKHVSGGGEVSLGEPPEDPREDWLVVVRKSGD